MNFYFILHYLKETLVIIINKLHLNIFLHYLIRIIISIKDAISLFFLIFLVLAVLGGTMIARCIMWSLGYGFWFENNVIENKQLVY